MTPNDMVDTLSVVDLVREIAQALVDEPAAVEVQSVAREENTVLRLKVAPQDVGKVVGRQGNVIRSLRTLAMTIGARIGRRIHLEIVQ